MPVQYHSSASNSSGVAGTALSITHGLTIPNGAYIVAIAHCNNDVTLTDNNGGNALSEIYSDKVIGPGSSYSFFARFATGSEPSTYDFTSSVAGAWALAVLIFTGVHPSNPWMVGPSSSSRLQDFNNSTATFPSITTTASALVMAVGLLDDGTQGYTTPTDFTSQGYTIQQDVANRRILVATKDVASAGTLPSFTASTSASTNDHDSFVIALRSSLEVKQNRFRFRNDDGSETTATWVASENTNITFPSDTNLRLRTLIDTTGDSESDQYQLEARINGGPWIRLRN